MHPNEMWLPFLKHSTFGTAHTSTPTLVSNFESKSRLSIASAAIRMRIGAWFACNPAAPERGSRIMMISVAGKGKQKMPSVGFG